MVVVTMEVVLEESGTFRLVATVKCGACGCGCPTVLEAGNGEDLVIVGKLDELVARAAAVKQHVGEGEIAVVIPKSLLLAAARSLA
jgi:hypothetical protein